MSGGVSRDPSGAQFPPALDTPAVNLLGREVRLRHPLHPPGTDTLWVEGRCSALVVDGSVGSGRGQVPAEALGGGRGHLGSLGIQIGEWGLGAEIGLGRGPNQPGTGVEHLLCARPWVTAWHSLDAVLGQPASHIPTLFPYLLLGGLRPPCLSSAIQQDGLPPESGPAGQRAGALCVPQDEVLPHPPGPPAHVITGEETAQQRETAASCGHSWGSR